MVKVLKKFTLELPKDFKVLVMPENFSINENHIKFESVYKLSGSELTVERSLVDTSPANICAPELTNAQRITAQKIIQSLQAQLVYQRI